MMTALKRLTQIALRNILRNKRRSLLTLSIIVFGITGLMLIGGFFENLAEGFREGYIHSHAGHLRVNVKGYHDKGTSDTFEYLIPDITKIQKIIQKNPDVILTVPRLQFGGILISEKTSMAVVVLGVDPDLESRMGKTYTIENSHKSSIDVVSGQDLDKSAPNGVVLGMGLMKALEVKEGDSITLITTKEGGLIDGSEYKVRGAFETLLKEVDDQTMKVNLASAQDLLNVPNEAHSILTILDKTKKTNAVRQDLAREFKSLGLPMEILTWQEQGDYYRKSKALLDQIYRTVQLIILIVFFFSISNTINMAIFERIREFGTMMALGNSRLTVFGTIFLETLFLGLIGVILGIAVGCGAAWIVSAIGIKMPPPPQGTSSYVAMITLYPRLFIEVGVITILSTALAAIPPAWRACHFRITEALGYV